MFIWLNTARSNFYEVIPGLYCVSRSLRKGRSGVSPSTDFETTSSHDAGVVYFTEYLSVLFQLTYLDELYGECNGTARACANSGYQAFFSPITEHLGMRLTRPAPLGLKVVARTLIYTTFFGGLAKGGGPVPDVPQETCLVVSLIPIHSRRVGTRPGGSCTRCTLRPELMSLDRTLRRCRDTSESSGKMKAAGPTHSGGNCRGRPTIREFPCVTVRV